MQSDKVAVKKVNLNFYKEKNKMDIFKNIDEAKSEAKPVVDISADGSLSIKNPKNLKSKFLDKFVHTAVFSDDKNLRDWTTNFIRGCARELGIKPSSIQSLYEKMGSGKIDAKFTVPAINIRILTYDMARAVIRQAIKNNVGAFIFEISKSEIGYTYQRPLEYATTILAAAIRENYLMPVFIQGDHFQFDSKNFSKDPDGETNKVKELTKEAIDAGFFNIDIDSSTLVDLTKSNLDEQQELNVKKCAELTKFIRDIEPNDITVSIGGEIGEIGKANSTPEEFETFINDYNSNLPEGIKGISKISIQTGTTHGGIPLADGGIAKVDLDFNAHKTISHIARKKYGLAGTVQHGASTLPEDMFDKFPQYGVAEVHLATEFQNIIYDHPAFPRELKEEIYEWVAKNCREDFNPKYTYKQNIYKTRKKASGYFKKSLWSLDDDIRRKIVKTLEQKFSTLFKKLNVVNTKALLTA